jgi:Ca-activated chloride channel family protein
MLRFKPLTLALAVTMFAAGPAVAETNILFILDGSNSMWGQIDGTAKIETAKSVLNDSLSDLGGHRQKDDCSDVQLVAPFGSGSVDGIRSAVDAVTPRGKTPIADSLKAAGEAFAGREEENNNILLISDGIETCEGDPCAVAAQLVQRGINVRVHVVGFDVDDETRAQLQCIAENGNGEYFDAKNASDFKQAVQQASQTAKEPEPEPEPKPVAKGPAIYFEDNFDGEDLGPDWEILNPDPDAYLVENGILTMVSADKTPATYAEAENVLRINKPIPSGDWTMTARFVFRPQTMGETFSIGVAKDNENSLLASLHMRSYNYALTETFVRGDKIARGEATGFERSLLNIESRDIEVRASQFSDKVKAVQLRLEKSGRNYVAALRFEATNPGAEGAVSEEWYTVQELTSLRAPGDAFTIVFGSNSNDYTPNSGEGLVQVDWVKVETPQ